eukprot:10301233-Alexandrium_andersonii.AAC.1
MGCCATDGGVPIAIGPWTGALAADATPPTWLWLSTFLAAASSSRLPPRTSLLVGRAAPR